MSTSVEAAMGTRVCRGRDPGGRLVAHNSCKWKSADMSGIGPVKLFS